LGINLSDEDKEKAVRNAINTMTLMEHKKILLVFDNISRSDFHKFINQMGPNRPIDIVITSRDGVGDSLHNTQVNPLSYDGLLKMFKAIVGEGYPIMAERDHTLLERYIEQVGENTAAIEFLSIAAREYKLPLSKLLDSNLETFSIDSESGPKEAIGALVEKLFRANSVSQDQQEVLRYLVCLPDEFVNYADYKDLIDIKKYEARENRSWRFRAEVVALSGIGWLRNTTEPESYKLHGLVSKALLPQLKPSEDNVADLLERLSHLLNAQGKASNDLDRFRWISIGKSVLHTVQRTDGQRYDKLAHSLADALFEFGKFGKAALMYKNVAKSYVERQLPEQAADVYSSLGKVSLTVAKRNDIKSGLGENNRSTAIDCFEKAISTLESLNQDRLSESLPLKLAENYLNLVRTHSENKGFESVQQESEKGLARLATYKDAKALSSSELKNMTAKIHSQLGNAFGERGQFISAAKSFKQALGLFLESNGEAGKTHDDTARAQLNLAKAYQRQALHARSSERGQFYSKAEKQLTAVIDGNFNLKFKARGQKAHVSLFEEQGNHDKAKELLNKYQIELSLNSSSESHLVSDALSTTSESPVEGYDINQKKRTMFDIYSNDKDKQKKVTNRAEQMDALDQAVNKSITINLQYMYETNDIEALLDSHIKMSLNEAIDRRSSVSGVSTLQYIVVEWLKESLDQNRLLIVPYSPTNEMRDATSHWVGLAFSLNAQGELRICCADSLNIRTQVPVDIKSMIDSLIKNKNVGANINSVGYLPLSHSKKDDGTSCGAYVVHNLSRIIDHWNDTNQLPSNVTSKETAFAIREAHVKTLGLDSDFSRRQSENTRTVSTIAVSKMKSQDKALDHIVFELRKLTPSQLKTDDIAFHAKSIITTEQLDKNNIQLLNANQLADQSVKAFLAVANIDKALQVINEYGSQIPRDFDSILINVSQTDDGNNHNNSIISQLRSIGKLLLESPASESRDVISTALFTNFSEQTSVEDLTFIDLEYLAMAGRLLVDSS